MIFYLGFGYQQRQTVAGHYRLAAQIPAHCEIFVIAVNIVCTRCKLRGNRAVERSDADVFQLRNYCPQVIIRREPAAAQFFQKHIHGELGTGIIAVVISEQGKIIVVAFQNNLFVIRVALRCFYVYFLGVLRGADQNVVAVNTLFCSRATSAMTSSHVSGALSFSVSKISLR